MLCAATAQAQSMRPFSTFRQLHGQTRLAARLEYGAGSLRIQPGRPQELYRSLGFDEIGATYEFLKVTAASRP